MNETQWNAFYQKTFGDIYFDVREWVDFALLSADEFPCLRWFKHYEPLELGMLAWMIVYWSEKKEFGEDDRDTEDELIKFFEEMDFERAQVIVAMERLRADGYIRTIGVIEETGSLVQGLNVFKLWREGYLEIGQDLPLVETLIDQRRSN